MMGHTIALHLYVQGVLGANPDQEASIDAYLYCA